MKTKKKAAKKPLEAKRIGVATGYKIFFTETDKLLVEPPPTAIGPHRVGRGQAIEWRVENVDPSKTLTIEIKNFTSTNPQAPKNPVSTTGPETLAPGTFDAIYGKVKKKGKGDFTYSYSVYIGTLKVDPEVVVCDDPGPNVPPDAKAPASAPKRKTRKKAAKK